ncbi:TadE/TadG family type IV pilus assembly protein [Streptomyces sp. N35]|uniref:TadE/TadG family type IV pilus assembly protein n=1 Tax=Streptomyces sp. N35 TaxID=2795730 RepID=UPI0018F68C75|nr:pilus assembly protein TadG-related protein [Streptomyces sp. N35]
MKLPGVLTARLRAARDDDRGQVLAFVVIVLAGLWLFVGIVVDGGLALSAKVRAMDVAQEAARTGAQQIDLEELRRHERVQLVAGRAKSEAGAYVAAAGSTGTVAVKSNEITVHVTHRQRTQVLQLIGIRNLTVTAEATAQAQQAEPAT